jgi:hypothetical protein
MGDTTSRHGWYCQSSQAAGEPHDTHYRRSRISELRVRLPHTPHTPRTPHKSPLTERWWRGRDPDWGKSYAAPEGRTNVLGIPATRRSSTKTANPQLRIRDNGPRSLQPISERAVQLLSSGCTVSTLSNRIMFRSSVPLPVVGNRLLWSSRLGRRSVATLEAASRKEGDISSVFRSLSGGEEEPLPSRFADVKRSLLSDKAALSESWSRLLKRLKEETEVIKAQGPAAIPSIDFADIDNPSEEFNEALRKRGVAVVRQVIPKHEARAYKSEIEDYIAANPSTKGRISVLILRSNKILIAL